ncbi:MAG: hypothetical protein ACLFVU_00845 [Phycisphaerae bacterium]
MAGRIGFITLSFALVLVSQVSAAEKAEKQPAKPVSVEVTGKTISVNGYSQVPKGLFGVHWTDLDPKMIDQWGLDCARQMHGGPHGSPTDPDKRDDWKGLSVVIDCLGDRYHPALLLTKKDWKQHFEKLGTDFANQAKGMDHVVIAEFWNEPFLNWSYKPGVNYDPKFYETEGRAEGKPMTIKGWDEPLEHLVWGKAVRSVHMNGHTDLQAYLAYNYIGRFHPAGYEYEFRGRKFKNVETWWGRDPTQVSYWSGKQNAQFYTWMLQPFAKACKTTNPDVHVVAGWGFGIYTGDWKAWEMLIKPTIDSSWKHLDGIYEHHYHSDPRRVAASYEVVTAYGKTKYDRWLRGYNTECGGKADTQLPGSETVGKAKGGETDDQLRSAVGAYTYGMRDITYMIHSVPDKAVTRTTHGANKPGWGLGGDEFVFRMFKPLRGQLVKAESVDADVWPVASIHGGKLVVIVFNDHQSAKPVKMSVKAPKGTTFRSGHRSWVEVDNKARKLRIKTGKISVDEECCDGTVQIPGRSAVRFVFELDGTPAKGPQIQRKQFFSDSILMKVNPDEIRSVRIPVELPEDRSKVKRAVLRIGADGAGAFARLGDEGKFIPLGTGVGFAEIPLDPKQLKKDNRVWIQAGQEKADGFRMLTAGIVLDIE